MIPQQVTGATDVLAHALARPPRLGSGRLICIDGPAGSGKTTLAAALTELSGAAVVHMDDLYPGWNGLFDVDAEVLGLLGPLGEDRPGQYRRFDWAAGGYRESHTVDPQPLLVLEGVGSGNRAWRDLVTTLVWVEAPFELCLERGLTRGGEGVREHWLGWVDDEARLFAEQDTRAHADLVVDTGPAPS